MKYGQQNISIKALVRRNWLDTETRVKINDAKVEQYAAEKSEGDVFPDPVVFCDPKTQLFWVGDGFHRVLAEKRNGAKMVRVMVHRGRKIDAVLHCISANRIQRGLPLSTGDKVMAVGKLLTAPECVEWTMTRIAEFVGCSVLTVSHVKDRLGIERPEVVDKNGRPRRRQCVGKNRDEVASRREAVREGLLVGKTQEELADELEVRPVGDQPRRVRAEEGEGFAGLLALQRQRICQQLENKGEAEMLEAFLAELTAAYAADPSSPSVQLSMVPPREEGAGPTLYASIRRYAERFGRGSWVVHSCSGPPDTIVPVLEALRDGWLRIHEQELRDQDLSAEIAAAAAIEVPGDDVFDEEGES